MRFGSFLRDWPLAIGFGVFGSLVGGVLFGCSFMFAPESDQRITLAVLGACLLLPGLFTLGYGFSDFAGLAAGDSAPKRRPPLSRVSWLVRPPTVWGMRPTITFGGIGVFVWCSIYALFLPLLAIKRAIDLRRDPFPKPGDLVSLRAPDASGEFWICQVADSEGATLTLLQIHSSSRRRLSIKRPEFETPYTLRMLDTVAFESSGPKFVWRGSMQFWNPERGGSRARAGKYSAIEEASARVAEIERRP